MCLGANDKVVDPLNVWLFSYFFLQTSTTNEMGQLPHYSAFFQLTVVLSNLSTQRNGFDLSQNICQQNEHISVKKMKHMDHV